MKNSTKFIAGLILFAGLAAAHHSFEAEYYTEKTANVTGVVTKVDWQNPHAYIFGGAGQPEVTPSRIQ